MTYLAQEVAHILGKPSAYIAQVGQIIKPDQQAFGRGHRAHYSFRNIAEIAIYVTLNGFGVPRKHIANHIENLRRSQYRWLEEDGEDGWITMTADWRWCAGPTPNHTLATLFQAAPTRGIISIDLGAIKDDIRAKLGLEQRRQ